MAKVEIYCVGRRLRTDTELVEFSHERELESIATYLGDATSGWSLIRGGSAAEVAQVLGDDEYIPRRRRGELGAAEAAHRFGDPSAEQRRIRELPTRNNINLVCPKCQAPKITRHQDAIEKALSSVQAAADAGRLGGDAVREDGTIIVTLQQFHAIVSQRRV